MVEALHKVIHAFLPQFHITMKFTVHLRRFNPIAPFQAHKYTQADCRLEKDPITV